MAYPLQTYDILGAWQARRQREMQNEEMQRQNSDPNIIKQRMIAEDMAQEQLKSKKNTNRMEDLKYDLLTSPFDIIDFGRTGLNEPGPGWAHAASNEKKDKMLSQITGQPLPNRGISGGGGGGGGVNEPVPNAPTETVDNGQVTVKSGDYGYVGPANKQDSAQIAAELGKLYRPSVARGGSGGQPGSEFDKLYYPTSEGDSSISGAPNPYNRSDVTDLLAEQINNKNGIENLVAQAQGKGAMDAAGAEKLMGDISTNFNKESKKLKEPIEKLTKAKEAEIKNFMAHLSNKMDDNLVPPEVQQHYQKERDAQDFKTGENRRIQAQNYVTRAITSDPRFKELMRNQQAAVLAAIPAEMTLAESQGFNKLDLDEFFSKYGRKKKGK